MQDNLIAFYYQEHRLWTVIVQILCHQCFPTPAALETHQERWQGKYHVMYFPTSPPT